MSNIIDYKELDTSDKGDNTPTIITPNDIQGLDNYVDNRINTSISKLNYELVFDKTKNITGTLDRKTYRFTNDICNFINLGLTKPSNLVYWDYSIQITNCKGTYIDKNVFHLGWIAFNYGIKHSDSSVEGYTINKYTYGFLNWTWNIDNLTKYEVNGHASGINNFGSSTVMQLILILNATQLTECVGTERLRVFRIV